MPVFTIFWICVAIVACAGAFTAALAAIMWKLRQQATTLNAIPENHVKSETLQLSPLGVLVLKDALGCVKRHRLGPWNRTLVIELEDQLTHLKSAGSN